MEFGILFRIHFQNDIITYYWNRIVSTSPWYLTKMEMIWIWHLHVRFLNIFIELIWDLALLLLCYFFGYRYTSIISTVENYFSLVTLDLFKQSQPYKDTTNSIEFIILSLLGLLFLSKRIRFTFSILITPIRFNYEWGDNSLLRIWKLSFAITTFFAYETFPLQYNFAFHYNVVNFHTLSTISFRANYVSGSHSSYANMSIPFLFQLSSTNYFFIIASH